jgi:hypothetical protein
MNRAATKGLGVLWGVSVCVAGAAEMGSILATGQARAGV